MAVRTNKNICLFCFGDLDANRVCKTCRKRADDTPCPPHHIPQRTVIQSRYLFGKALGEGGFGITYLGWDLTNGERVAIKEYFPSGYVTRVANNRVMINGAGQQAAANRGLKRFMDEARTLAKVKNLDGVVSIKNCFKDNGTAYIVMEYLSGGSLKKHLARKGGKIGFDETLTITRKIIESLGEVHKLGLVHRDISPDNIILERKGAKLIDFGAAKQSNLDGKSLSIVLKQGFAPEEQYRTHGEQVPWTDIYALAVTIYLCITGQMPPESIQRMYKDTMVRPSALGAKISVLQEGPLLKGMAVLGKNRYQNVEQFLKALYILDVRTSGVTASATRANVTLQTAAPSSREARKANPIDVVVKNADKKDKKREKELEKVKKKLEKEKAAAKTKK